jgi:ArsR family transcriptional regulator
MESTAALISTAEPAAQEQAQRLLRALAEPIRLQVVQALQHGERCVCDLTGDLDLAQSKLSFHLKVLKEAGLIRARQEGRWIYYRLDPAALIALQDWLGQLAAGWRHKREAVQEIAEELLRLAWQRPRWRSGCPASGPAPTAAVAPAARRRG